MKNQKQKKKMNIMINNLSSLNHKTKKMYRADIVSNTSQDIIILMKTFLLDDSNLFIKKDKTYKLFSDFLISQDFCNVEWELKFSKSA